MNDLIGTYLYFPLLDIDFVPYYCIRPPL